MVPGCSEYTISLKDLLVALRNRPFDLYEGAGRSWQDINPEINFSQMLHSARIYQLPLTNGLCCIQTTHTVQNYIGNIIIQNLPALKEKQVSA